MSNQNVSPNISMQEVQEQTYNWIEDDRLNNQIYSNREVVTYKNEIEFEFALSRECSDRFLRWLSTRESSEVAELLDSKEEWINMAKSKIKSHMLQYSRVQGDRGGNLAQAPTTFQNLYNEIVDKLSALHDFIGKDMRSHIPDPDGKKGNDGKVIKVDNPNFQEFVQFTHSKPMIKSDYKVLNKFYLSRLANIKDEQKVSDAKLKGDHIEYFTLMLNNLKADYLEELEKLYPEILETPEEKKAREKAREKAGKNK